MLPSHPGRVRSHRSQREHPRSSGMRSLCTVPGQGGGIRTQTFPTKGWKSAARHYTQDFAAIPKPNLPQLGSLRSEGLQHHQPTHSSAATTQRTSQVSSSSSEKAALPVPGVDRTLSKPGRAPKGLIHLMSPGTEELAGDLLLPLCPKQPLSWGQQPRDTGQQERWQLETLGVSVWPHTTEIPLGMKQLPPRHCRECWGQQGETLLYSSFSAHTLSLTLQRGSWLSDHLPAFAELPPAPCEAAAFL